MWCKLVNSVDTPCSGGILFQCQSDLWW